MSVQVGVGKDFAIIVLDGARLAVLESSGGKRNALQPQSLTAPPPVGRMSIENTDRCLGCTLLSNLNLLAYFGACQGIKNRDRLRRRQRQIEPGNPLFDVPGI
jgi:hypothetical protein